jgi:tetratricopeptide (TPR) repeat protein
MDSVSSLAEAAYNAGVTAAQAGDLVAAELHFRQAVELAPGYLEAFFNLGAVLLEAGRPSEAVAVFEAALKVDPEYPFVHFMLGTAYGMLGEPRQSFFATVQGLKFAPGDALAQANAGRAAFQLHAYTDAAVRYLLAIREHEEEHAHLVNLGAALMHLTRVGHGELLDGGLDLQEANSLARVALGLWCLGLDDEAASQTTTIATLDPGLGAQLRQVVETQEPLRQSLFTLAARVNAEPTFATEEVTGGRA